MKLAILAAIFCLVPLLVPAQPAELMPPPGWRFPEEADYTGSWRVFRAVIPEPFHAQGDFNGDGLPDDAWIMFSTLHKAPALFVFLAQPAGSAKVITLDKIPATIKPQTMGIKVAPPGEYKTACGKGYYKCGPHEPEVLHLTLPAINYFVFEGANSFFWWDAQTQSFKRTWMGY